MTDQDFYDKMFFIAIDTHNSKGPKEAHDIAMSALVIRNNTLSPKIEFNPNIIVNINGEEVTQLITKIQTDTEDTQAR